MSQLKPTIPISEVHAALADTVDATNGEWQQIDDGDTSTAYDLLDNRILRLNVSNDRGFRRDAIASKHYTAEGLPIPQTFTVGQVALSLGDTFFSMTEKAAGTLVEHMTPQEQMRTAESILGAVSVMSQTTPAGSGYGSWYPHDRKATATSWYEALRRTQEAAHDPELKNIDFFDTDIQAEAEREINALIAACSDRRTLVHGDYSVSNILAQDGKVTGVIDWYNSMYGDTVYDIAWFDFDNPELDAAKQFQDRMGDADPLMADYQDRIRCYQLLIGMNGMAYLAKYLGQERYDRQHERTRQILEG